MNKGRKMLEKMGWKKGEGLGKEGTGMKDPVRRRRDFLFDHSAECCCRKNDSTRLFFFASFHFTDSAENQEVPVGFGGGCRPVGGQPRHEQKQIPEELGEGTREVRRFVPGGHAALQEPGGDSGGGANHVGQSRTGSCRGKRTDWFQYRRTKSGISQSCWTYR